MRDCPAFADKQHRYAAPDGLGGQCVCGDSAEDTRPRALVRLLEWMRTQPTPKDSPR